MATSSQVALKDVTDLIRLNRVAVPSGFTKLGLPIIYFPDSDHGDLQLDEGDLHLLFKYFLSVVPRTEQNVGFALIVDRRNGDWQQIARLFRKVASLFPATIKVLYLLHDIRGVEVNVRRLAADLMLDFEVVPMTEPRFEDVVDSKCLPIELGGSLNDDVESWIALQEHVESFSANARRIARRLAQFVGVLNAEDVNAFKDDLRQVAAKNRSNYRRLRDELSELTEHGLVMLKRFQRPEANVMQRLAVQVLCKQLEQAWTYFNRSWKMQDHIYVQYLELETFQQRFRDISAQLAHVEAQEGSLCATGNCAEEVDAAFDRLESCAEAARIVGAKALELSGAGAELLAEHEFVADSVRPKCAELDAACARLDANLGAKRRSLLKFRELFDALDSLCKWSTTADTHIERDNDENQEAFSQIRQIDFMLSKSRELKLKSRVDFEADFEVIRDSMSAQTLFAVDDAIERLEAVTFRVMQKREQLRSKAIRSDRKQSTSTTSATSNNEAEDAMKIRRENVMQELVGTETSYVLDLCSVLDNYRPEIEAHDLAASKIVFANLEAVRDFHASYLKPELERCGANPGAVARVFLGHAHTIKSLYAEYCQNMESARNVIDSRLGGESHNSLLSRCQKRAGHPLPLSSYLLKPVQRLTKYQLLLKDLTTASNVVCGRPELEEAVEELINVVKVVNDSMKNDIAIKGLPAPIRANLGALNANATFQVTSEAGTSQLFRASRGQRRSVFLYDKHVVFAKPASNEKSFTFKFSLATSGLGMSSVVKGDDRKIELWLHGGRNNDLYVLEAKNKKAKEDFAAELRKVLIRQKEKKEIQPPTTSTTVASTSNSTSSESSKRLSRSRSLESRRSNAPLRSRSLDCDRSSPDDDLDDEDEDDLEIEERPHFVALADYVALTNREIDLGEDDVVELIKVGCAGWWYVRLAVYPFQEGWAPSTYLEKLK